MIDREMSDIGIRCRCTLRLSGKAIMIVRMIQVFMVCRRTREGGNLNEQDLGGIAQLYEGSTTGYREGFVLAVKSIRSERE